MKNLTLPQQAARTTKAVFLIASLILSNFTGVLTNRAGAAPVPVAAFNFNEGTGSTAANAYGSGNTGTVSGATWTSAGKNGGALSFDGVNDLVTVNDNATLDLTNKMSLSAWVKPNALTNNWSTIVMKERGGNGLSYSLYASDGSNQPPAVYGYISNSDRSAAGSSTLPLNTWSHVTGTYDGANFRLYVNGTLVRTVARTGNMTTSNNPLRIGGNSVWGEYFSGTLDDVRIYNVALTQTEVQADMNTPVGPVDNTPPSAPTNLAASGVTGTQTTLNWAASSDNVGVTGYRVQRNGVQVGTSIGTTYTDTGLTAGTTYTYTVAAVDAANNVSVVSNAVSVTTPAPTPDFSFTPLQTSRTVAPTGSTFFEVDVAYLNGFTSSNLDLWTAGVPAGVTGEWLFDPMAHQGRTEFLIDTSGAAEGAYTLTLGATDVASGLTHSQQVTLVVNNTPDFSIGIAPQIQNITAGGLTTFDVALTGSGGFNSPVTFTTSGLPAATTASFTPSTVTGSGTTTMTVATSSNTPAGQYNVTITATGGSLTRTVQATINVVASNATWTVATLGSTGTQNNTVRVGKLKGDGVERIYVGTIGTGRMLEYSWNGSAWAGPVDVGGSPTGQEIHNVTIGSGRGDGVDRIYAASYDNKIYEIWYNGTSWQQQVVATLDDLGMHAAVGDGRNDGVTRLYAASTQKLYEYTWNGTAWTGGVIGNTPGAHGTVVGNGRNNGSNSVFVASISSGTFEARYVNNAWVISSMGDSGDVRDVELGNGRNDGVMRVYAALLDGRIREFTWNGSSWGVAHTPSTQDADLIHAYILAGRNDGVNRLYTSSSNGKAYEFTWNGSSWQTPVNMGGGNDYMYGMHYGFGRNDGVMRLYGADRGSVNRVYEFTWTGSAVDSQPPTAASNLTATALSPTNVELVWAASTDNVGVAGYVVKRNGVTIAQPTTTTYVDNTVLPGQTYTYIVQARDGAGNTSPDSNQATVTTDNPPDTSAPTAPANLAGTTFGSNRIDLTWSASTDNIAVSGYQIWRDGVQVATTSSLNFSDTGLTPNTTYSYVVRATDNAGNVSANSNTVTMTTPALNTVPGLVAAFSFNEGTGMTVADKAGVHNGTVAGATWSAAGRYGNALSFDGAADWVTVGDANSLDLTTGMTLEAWVRPTSLQGWTTVLMKEAGGTMAYSLYASDNTNRPPAGYAQIGGDQSVVGTQNLPLNTWSHLAVTYDSSTMRVYINGTLVATRALTGAMMTSTGNLRIGGNAVWGEYFAGLIDEVRVYNRALSQGEIQFDMNTAL